jgi:hypothetical protein
MMFAITKNIGQYKMLWYCPNPGIDSIQNTAVARNDVAGIFYIELPLDHAFAQVAKGS